MNKIYVGVFILNSPWWYDIRRNLMEIVYADGRSGLRYLLLNVYLFVQLNCAQYLPFNSAEVKNTFEIWYLYRVHYRKSPSPFGRCALQIKNSK